MSKIVVLGGGPSGLSPAWQIGSSDNVEVNLYEKDSRIGGVCGYYYFEGIKLDYGAHKVYSVLPGMMNLFIDIAGDKLLRMKKNHKIIVRGKLLDYPVKIKQILPLFSAQEIFLLSLSVLTTIVSAPFRRAPLSYEDYCVNVFGRRVYEAVFRPLAEKIWGTPRDISADIARTRIPTRNVFDLLLRMTGIRGESKDTDAKFMLYPRNGFYQICDSLADKIISRGHKIYCNKYPVKIKSERNKIISMTFNDGDEVKPDLLISSIPLYELMRLLFPDDAALADRANYVKMRHSVIAYLLVNKIHVLKDHWIFCADKDIKFSRVSEQKLFSGEQFPEDKTILACDFTCDNEDPIYTGPDNVICQQCIEGLEKLGFLKSKEVEKSFVVRLPYFYPIYDRKYASKVQLLIHKLNSLKNVITTGRLGLSNYSNLDHCVDMGLSIASMLREGLSPNQINIKLFERVRGYRIVD